MEKHILLVGMPGSGKSTLGKKWAEERAVPFYEIDEMLALKFGKSISEFVDECGWERFRSEELIQVEQVFKLEKGVVVPGGGFFSNQFNVNLALKNAEVYFLDVSIEILISRFEKEDERVLRPLLNVQNWREILARMYADREMYYAQAHHRILHDTQCD